MSLPVVLRDEAQAELEEAYDFYESRQAGLGIDLVTKVQKVFDRIANNPQTNRIVFADIRQAGVARFPYSVFYRFDSSRVDVIAVFHSSRDPSIWQARA